MSASWDCGEDIDWSWVYCDITMGNTEITFDTRHLWINWVEELVIIYSFHTLSMKILYPSLVQNHK